MRSRSFGFRRSWTIGTRLRSEELSYGRKRIFVGIGLTVIVGITQLILGGMGVFVSLRPPKKERHWHWMLAFILVGLAGVLTTAWLAKTGDAAQRAADREIHEANGSATSASIAATSAASAATKANQAATDANNASVKAQRETEAARNEARKAQTDLSNLINQRSTETKSTITQWRSDTESAVSKILRPPRTLAGEDKTKFISVLKLDKREGMIEVLAAPSEESQHYAGQLILAFKEAGWYVLEFPRHELTHPPDGVLISIRDAKKVPPEADDLTRAFAAIGVKTQGNTSNQIDEGMTILTIGFQ